MTGQVVIFLNATGKLSVVFPMSDFPVAEVAKKDVPAGVSYLIVDQSALPPDWEFSDAWTADFSKPDGVGMGHDAWAAQYNDPESLEMRDEARAENARIDMWPVMIGIAEQENAQFDALQALKVAS